MRLLTSALAATAFASLLASCSGGTSTTGMTPTAASPMGHSASHNTLMPHWASLTSVLPEILRPHGPMPLHGNPPPRGGNGMGVGGIYVSEYYSTEVYEYSHKNTSNNGPNCSYTGVSYPNDIAADRHGNVIIPDGATRTVKVYKGMGMCGSEIGAINDIYGQPSDAAAGNAQSGTVAVANVFDVYTGGGSVSVCSMKGGCTNNLINSNMYEVFGVAMYKNGDCWASSYSPSGTAELTWFQGCTGPGQTATGYLNTYPGGLDIDTNGNLIALSAFDGTAYVYSGCNPTCTLVNGPQPLEGMSTFGHFNRQAMAFVAADWQNGQVDIYKYNKTSSTLKYWYSFNNGLNASDEVLGATFAPSSEQ